jgi:hypothetical protein
MAVGGEVPAQHHRQIRSLPAQYAGRSIIHSALRSSTQRCLHTVTSTLPPSRKILQRPAYDHGACSRNARLCSSRRTRLVTLRSTAYYLRKRSWTELASQHLLGLSAKVSTRSEKQEMEIQVFGEAFVRSLVQMERL